MPFVLINTPQHIRLMLLVCIPSQSGWSSLRFSYTLSITYRTGRMRLLDVSYVCSCYEGHIVLRSKYGFTASSYTAVSYHYNHFPIIHTHSEFIYRLYAIFCYIAPMYEIRPHILKILIILIRTYGWYHGTQFKMFTFWNLRILYTIMKKTRYVTSDICTVIVGN